MRGKLVAELEALRAQERAQERRRLRLQQLSGDWTYAVWRLLYPIRFTVGLSLLLVSAALVTTLAVSLVDMWLHSMCGARCGFVMDAPVFPNPTDRVLVLLSRYFPLDYVVMGFVAVYLLLCTIFGIVRLGVRVMGVQVFEIKPRRTWPQAMLLLCALLMASLLAIMVLVVAIAPQYTAFGNQTYKRPDAATGLDTLAPCVHSQTAARPSESHGNGRPTFESPLCVATQLSVFLSRLTVAYPIFSVLFYGAYWAVVLVAGGVGLTLACRKGGSGDGAGADYDSASDDEEELDMKAYRESASLL